ncbi:MAG: DUF2332 family protein [Acidimicrobiales bacterium]
MAKESVIGEPDIDDARRRYHHAMAPEDYERLPFYSALLGELENDHLALELLASVRASQRNPMLVLAALQLAALRGHPVLAPMYDDARRGELRHPRNAAYRVIAALGEEPSLVRDELWRSTQTNEPGRSAVLQAVVADLARSDETVNILEVGASAGINLRFDQFPVRAHDDANPLTLVCEDRSEIDRTRLLPRVNERVGIDLNPLSLGNEEDRLWLKACLWAEERRRHERFDAIVAAQARWPSATILRGSVRERLDEALVRCTTSATTIIVNTWTAAYFSHDEREWYFDEVSRRCALGAVAWISVESPMVTWPGIDATTEDAHRAASQIVVTRPGATPVRWGWCHAHGRWLERTTVA